MLSEGTSAGRVAGRTVWPAGPWGEATVASCPPAHPRQAQAPGRHCWGWGGGSVSQSPRFTIKGGQRHTGWFQGTAAVGSHARWAQTWPPLLLTPRKSTGQQTLGPGSLPVRQSGTVHAKSRACGSSPCCDPPVNVLGVLWGRPGGGGVRTGPSGWEGSEQV